MTLPRIDINYGDSIPILAFWDDDHTGTPVRITLVGTTGHQLNVATEQLCSFTLTDQSTVSSSNPNGTPVTFDTTLYQNVPLLLDTVNTQAVYTVQDPIPPGRYTIDAVYDSTATTDPNIAPFRKHAFGEVIITYNTTGGNEP